jgi:hypothetical protein
VCTTVQATAFTVHVSVSIIYTLMNVRQFYILAKAKGFNDCLSKCALPDDGPKRPDICSTLRILTLILLMWRKGWAPNSIPVYIQQDATLHSLFISENCCTYFGWYFHPSSGAHTPVSTASGIFHTVTAICRYQLEPVWVCCGWRTPPTTHSNRFQLFHDSGR